MRWAPTKRFLRPLLWAAALAAPIVLLAGWVAARTWYPAHLEQVTGRTDTGEISCLYCHRRTTPPPVRGATADSGKLRYPSPEGIAVSRDGKFLFVAAAGIDRVLKVDVARKAVVRSIDIAGRPHGIAISADDDSVIVSSRDAGVIHVLDAATLALRRTIPAGPEPLGVAVSRHSERIFVADGAGDDILVATDHSTHPSPRLPAGHQPYALALSRDERLLAVSNRLSRPVPPKTLPVSEITLVDTAKGRVADRRSLVSAHLSTGIAISSDASFVLATITHVRNLLPITQVARGALMNSAVAFIETEPGGRTIQFPLSEVNAYFANPAGIALTPDDRTAFVSHGGASVVTAVDVAALRKIAGEASAATLQSIADDMGVSSHYVRARIPTRDNPRAMVVSPDGRRVYVAEHLADSIAVIDTRRLAVIDRIDLGGPRKLTAERRGERLFHNASTTFQGQFSCSSCHPGGHSDGLVWDFAIDGIGKNLVETRSLLGIRDTAPFKWNGKNPDLHTQCGPRFARVLTRSDPFTPAQLDDLVTYIESLPLPARRLPERMAEARERGREIFFRERANSGKGIPIAQRCHTCHRPPLFTDRLKADVGTGGSFDTPHLLDVRSTAPYLHDGRALTLEEIWTVFSPNNEHGVTNDLTKIQLNDLIIYLGSL